MSRSVAIVAAHFVPSNLAGVHRTRLWVQHLEDFGWNPIVVTTDSRFYEEELEPDLLELVDPGLEIIRTKALPAKPLRIVGDIGIRGFVWHYRALSRLARAGKIDFLHITIPSNYSACLGRMINRRYGIPYGIDYIDPWVHSFPGSDQPATKAWCSARLAELLEPWAVREAALITGINRNYFLSMLERNPAVRDSAVLADMQYGGSENDHAFVRVDPKAAHLFAGSHEKFNLVYAGAMLPQAYPVLKVLLEGIALLKRSQSNLKEQFHLHFVGTGKAPDDASGHNILPYIRQFRLEDCVSEHPQRMKYLEVLTHLHAASGVLVLGSIEPHYSPSKIFQSVLSRRPVFAVLHENSTAVPVLRATNAAEVVTLREDALPSPDDLADRLRQFIFANEYSEVSVKWEVLEQYSARESARKLAEALDEALLRNAAPHKFECAWAS